MLSRLDFESKVKVKMLQRTIRMTRLWWTIAPMMLTFACGTNPDETGDTDDCSSRAAELP